MKLIYNCFLVTILHTNLIPFKLAINYTSVKFIIWPVTSERQSAATIEDYGAGFKFSWEIVC